MHQHFRFSPRSRADQIRWREWGSDAFEAAAAADQPVLLCLTAIWCQWCRQMDETTYSEPAVIELINHHFTPIRVDADQFPHVHDRYIAGGWPTNAFLTPTGEVLWAGTYIPHDQFLAVATSVRTGWVQRRDELAAEIERRRKALEAARGRVRTVGIVRREAADDVWSSVLESFDPRNGGFTTAPKFPTADAVELVFLRAPHEGDTLEMARHTLDGMLAGELWDAHSGGFFRYALADDWTNPQAEKLLTVNAALLRVYALGSNLLNQARWAAVAEQSVQWADQTLRLEHGFWAASQAATASEAAAVDPVLYTSANAQWLRALAEAGARLNRPEWAARAAEGVHVLLRRMAAPNELFYHYQEPDAEPQLPHLLLDAAEVAKACLAAGQAAGDVELIHAARRIAGSAEKWFWADDGGFYDRTRSSHDVGVLRYRDRPFDLNAELARVLLDLALAFGEPSFRALAERTLALLSPLAGRFGVGAACFASAVHDFFDPPAQLVVTGRGPDADELRRVALSLPIVSRRVWPLPDGGKLGRNTFQRLDRPAVYALGQHGVSRAITDPAHLGEAVLQIL